MGQTRYVLGAALFALVGIVTLKVGLMERDLAAAEERMIAGEFAGFEDVLDRAERYYAYFERIPGIGGRSMKDIATRKAAVQYWQRRYAEPTDDAEPLANVPEDNLNLQFVMANAQYRSTIAHAHDRATVLAALENGIAAYLTVVRNATRHEDAAFNFEFLLRTRQELRSGRRKAVLAPDAGGPFGQSGAPQKQSESGRFKIYVPLDGKELEKSQAGEAGKSTPMKRKG